MNLKFWKKNDDFALPEDLSKGFDLPPTHGMGAQPDPLAGTPPYAPGQPHPPTVAFAPAEPAAGPPGRGGELHSAQMEVVLARLDAIRSQLESINQRLANVERNQTERDQRKTTARGPWYASQ